jgi:hypothetical protein
MVIMPAMPQRREKLAAGGDDAHQPIARRQARSLDAVVVCGRFECRQIEGQRPFVDPPLQQFADPLVQMGGEKGRERIQEIGDNERPDEGAQPGEHRAGQRRVPGGTCPRQGVDQPARGPDLDPRQQPGDHPQEQEDDRLRRRSLADETRREGRGLPRLASESAKGVLEWWSNGERNK